MQFAPDTVESLEFAAELANTDAGASRSRTDELSTVEDLDRLIDRYPFSGRRDHDDDELADVRATRDFVRRIWAAERDTAVEIVNETLLEARAVPHLERHDGYDWHLHATSPDAPLGERIRVEASLAFLDVIRMDQLGRMRFCDADDCTGLVVDLSRNGSKRFCTVRCGNRMNMIAFRERQASG